MKLYFVRHGESKAKGYHSDPSIALSSTGIQQARNVSNRFRNIPIDIIISSNHTRAQQTAEIISSSLSKKVFYTDLLGEWKIPSLLIGQKVDNPDAIKIKKILRKNAKLQDWHYEDEENVTEFRNRIIQFFDYLSIFKEENIMVVAHAGTIRMIIALITLRELLTGEEFYRFDETFKTVNTGITYCERDDDGVWKIHTWNDHAHLG
ncbi:MAG TPA: histidine phosphatase family protein [Candidatus Levybacteria bacterium]|nr:histidine phosphatase family protein [Candidatus Levybacteria bacterium]